jgi:hypothetical protein
LAVAGNNLLMHVWQYLAVSIMMNFSFMSRQSAADRSTTVEKWFLLHPSDAPYRMADSHTCIPIAGFRDIPGTG